MFKSQWTLLIMLFIISTSISKNSNQKHKSNTIVGDREYYKKIETQNITNWGVWGKNEFCPNGTYAMGMKLQVQTYQGNRFSKIFRDDTALNGIELFCGELGSNEPVDFITSTHGIYGDFGNDFFCEDTVMNGFKIRAMKKLPLRPYNDNMAATNIMMICGNNEMIEGNGLPYGDWYNEKRCLSETAVCGIQTQVQPYQGGDKGDNTMLNNLRLYCCKVPNLGSTCNATDKWEMILTCDNLDAKTPTTCEYSKRVGISKSIKATETQTKEYKVQKQIGFQLSVTYAAVSATFSGKMSDSYTTKHEWKTESSSTWSEETSVKTSFRVPGRTKAVLKQVVGNCGYFSVNSNYFKKEEFLANGTLIQSTIIDNGIEKKLFPIKKSKHKK